jgi:hypothetical protein
MFLNRWLLILQVYIREREKEYSILVMKRHKRNHVWYLIAI